MPVSRKVGRAQSDVGGRDVDARDGLGRHDQPAYGRRRLVCSLKNPFLKQLGVGEEQWRVPAEKDKAGDEEDLDSE